MENKLYYIECKCIKDVKFPNTEFHLGDILYYNGNASSNEMYVFNNSHGSIEMDENAKRYRGLCSSYLPFTRQKKNARKYKQLKQAQYIKSCIEYRGDFNCEIKEIKITYTEEEI